MINMNLAKSVPNKGIRDGIVRVFYGIVPKDGRTHSLAKLLSKEDNKENSDSRAVRIDPSKR